MWNPFGKNNQKEENSPKMNMLQRLAMKRMERMSPNEKAKMMQDVLRPENKAKLISAMEMMRKSGQISQEQYDLAKQKMDM